MQASMERIKKAQSIMLKARWLIKMFEEKIYNPPHPGGGRIFL